MKQSICIKIPGRNSQSAYMLMKQSVYIVISILSAPAIEITTCSVIRVPTAVLASMDSMISRTMYSVLIILQCMHRLYHRSRLCGYLLLPLVECPCVATAPIFSIYIFSRVAHINTMHFNGLENICFSRKEITVNKDGVKSH
jgi:hypothetical protein